MQFTKGQQVVITDNKLYGLNGSSYHSFAIGQVVTVDFLVEEDNCARLSSGNVRQYVELQHFSSVEIKNNKMALVFLSQEE